jgi:hypothetical protein
MSDVFVSPLASKLANAYNGLFGRMQRSFSLSPLGGMSSQSGAETTYSPWVQMPSEQSALDLALATTTLTGTEPSLQVTVQTCRVVIGGSAVDTPRSATGGAFATQFGAGTLYAQCLVLQWVRLAASIGGVSPASAFTVTGTGVPLGLELTI